MNGQPFTLLPFPGAPAPALHIRGSASREGALLTVAWALSGAVAAVEWPEPEAGPERRDQLWQATCCEFFLACPAEPGYWEANCSPAGHWQLYRFDGYRTGMRPEGAISPPALAASRSDETLSLTACLDLSPLCGSKEPLLLGATMVVRGRDGGTSYWAPAHPGERPDFHLRPGWTIAL
ncbi:MAG: DOMON-like domain-containing protein [Thermodesulfobacteriota bacterium]